MATRDLPNVYVTLNDQSALIEGNDSLIVGVTLRANRGPMYEAVHVQDSSDFLTKFTFTGKPGVKQDTTYFDILELLKVSSNVYVSRAANNPLFGGLIVRKSVEIGEFLGAPKDNPKRALFIGDATDKIKAGDKLRITYEGELLGTYTVAESDEGGANDGKSVACVGGITQIVLTKDLPESVQFADEDRDEKAGAIGKGFIPVAPLPINRMVIAEGIIGLVKKTLRENGEDVEANFLKLNAEAKDFQPGDRFRIEGYNTVVTDAKSAIKFYTVKAEPERDEEDDMLLVRIAEEIEGTIAEDANLAIKIYRDSIANPSNALLTEKDLFLVTGIDQGAYNGNIGIEIISGDETDLGESGVFRLRVYNWETSTYLEDYDCAMGLVHKSLDGSNLHIKEIINDSSKFIKIFTHEDEDVEDVVPAGFEITRLGGGYDGDPINVSDNIAALQVFADKAVPVSLLINGNNENKDYQEALLTICENRKDCFVFLRSLKAHEDKTSPAQRVTDIINWKKKKLDNGLNTSYLAAMFGPHVKVTDNYNTRKVTIGMDSLACRKYIQVLHDLGHPYVAAGPRNGKVDGIVVDWKIGDESTEAKNLNDASLNTLVYEARQKYYYLNTQNTLQLANTTFRNIGAVLNILDIKENLTKRLKDYVQLPITDTLRADIKQNMELYLDGIAASRLNNYIVKDVTTVNDIVDNELHYILVLSPVNYAQKIYLVMNVVNAAFDFQVLQSV
jgi:hypothetical protein